MQHRLVVARLVQLQHVPPALWLAGVAWLVLVAFSLTGNGAVIRHDRLLQGGPPLWLATILFVGGWQVMLLAMMVPASLHAFSLAGGGRRIALFTGGYLLAWTLFGLLIFFLDVGVHATVNHWAWLAGHPWLIAGTTLVLAGTYQLSDLKARSLAACRRVNHARGAATSARAGAVHGLKCVGSSWGLMLVAFALAAGNVLTMAAITLLMAWEVTPWGASAVKVTGYALVALGAFVLVGPVPSPV